MYRNSMKGCGFAAAMAAGLLATGPAAAEILVAQTRTSHGIYGGATYTVDFNGAAAGGTSFEFSTTGSNKRVVLMFNAECAHNGATTSYVGIDILVDPAGATPETAAAPSAPDYAFCSGNGNTVGGSGSFTLDGWVSAAAIRTIVLPQGGTHKVRVRVNGNGGVTRLDEMSLIVMR
jgi:hypothetical protein